MSCDALIEVGGGLARCGKPAVCLCDFPYSEGHLAGACSPGHASVHRTVSIPLPPGGIALGSREGFAKETSHG